MSKKKVLNNSDQNDKIQQIIGFGEFSARKSYYPELQKKITELENEKKKYERIFTDALAGIFQATLDGKIIVANQAILDMCSYESADFHALTDIRQELFESHNEFEKLLNICSTTEHCIGFETRFKKSNDTLIDVSLNASLQKENNVQFIEFFVQDISPRIQAEQEKAELEKQLRQSQKLETIGTLAGGIAHDFNNILTPILGYAEMALANLPSTEQLDHDLQNIITGAERAKELIQQILTFSKQVEHEKEPLQLHTIVQEAVQLLRPSIPQTIKIHTNVQTTCNSIMADPIQMHQLVVNLCTNAYQAIKNTGGIIEIALHPTILDADFKHSFNSNHAEYLHLSIRDTGIGMDSHVLERIFEPFFSTKEANKGTGMGLSVVHGIVQNHNGMIDVKSEPGKGSTFSVYLPTIQSVAKVKTKHENKIKGGKESILVVDDDASVAKIVYRMLEHLGYTVMLETDSRKALELIREQPAKYDLIVSDLTMPNLTGLELAEQIKTIRAEMPILIMTGFGDNLDDELCEKYGIARVTSKPINIKDLSQLVRAVLAKK